MPGSGIFMDFKGVIDHESINSLLKTLKSSEEFLSLNKTTGKRLYAIIVECLENIARHSIKSSSRDLRLQPFIFANRQGNKILIRSGNPLSEDQKLRLIQNLDLINSMDDAALTALYDEIITREKIQDDKGAGLGLILIKLKSGNRIDYSFSVAENGISLFEINILINAFIMRKLIFEKTDSSPKVILDPDKNVFEMSGESRPPDAGTFYGEILRWMDDFSLHLFKSNELADPVVFNFDLEYFNSSSAKYILDFCKQMASVRSKGKGIEVKWKYEEDDADMLEAGKEMSRISKIPFEFVKKVI
jgi:hypothetical protein